MNRSSSLLCFVLLTLACAEERPATPDGGSDASTVDASRDASSPVDASSDAWSPVVDASRGPGPSLPDASPGSQTARCVELAIGLRDRCDAMGTDSRACQWHAYAALCGTGETDLLVAAMMCFGDEGCPAFSDANAADECLALVHADGDESARYDAYSELLTGCGATPSLAGYSVAEIFPYLGDDDAAALSSCAGSACSLDGISDACSDEIHVIAPFACGN